MATMTDFEQFLDKNVDLKTLENMILSLNATSSRRLKNPLSFSLFTNTEDHVMIELCSNRHQMSLCIPAEKYRKDNSPIMHSHDYYELMYIQKGMLRIQIEEEIYTYYEGDVCLFNQKIHHAEIQNANSSILYCCIAEIFLEKYPHSNPSFYPADSRPFVRFFSEEQDDDSLSSSSFLEFRRRNFSLQSFALQNFQASDLQNLQTDVWQDEISALLLGMKNELKTQCPGAWLIIYGLFCRLMHTLADPAHYDCQFVALKTQSLVDTVIRYLESSPGRLSRKDIQSQLHYNCDYLNRIFRQNTGMTLLSYCNYICMKKAAYLLLQTDDTVEEIAASVGFSNPSQFYRQFRKQFHMTPHEYRKTCFEILARDDGTTPLCDEMIPP